MWSRKRGDCSPDPFTLLDDWRCDTKLHVSRANPVLGVSARTIYTLARQGALPATRVGREWRFARKNLIAWVANGSQADQLATALRHGRVAPRER
jgi:excisionase family DNA binding protein